MAIIDILNQIKAGSNIENKLSEKFGLNLNPFPKSGIANISDPDQVLENFGPVNKDVRDYVVNYMKDALSNSGVGKRDKYVSLVIRGEYGSGKTQLLMYMRYVFSQLDTEGFHPYVIYIDNPGLSISELIGNVVSQIGVENFRRYLWDAYLSYLDGKRNDSDSTRKQILLSNIQDKLSDGHGTLFPELTEINWEESILSYKMLMDKVIHNTTKAQQKEISEIIRTSMSECFLEIFKHSTVVDYFYNIVVENISMLKSWDAIVGGSIKNMDKNVVYILNAIVNIIKNYLHRTDFIILVDEFEEIATGRLKEADLDNYLRNLRALIDKERQWCSVFAMTGQAFKKIQQVSPPLASRIGDRCVDLKPFNFEEFKKVVANYLNLAREKRLDSIFPFTEEALKSMLETKNTLLEGSPRYLLKNCYLLLQRAAEDLAKGQSIDATFVKKYMSDSLK